MQSVTEAAQRISSAFSPLPTESVPLRAAMGRVLAAAITSPITLPHWTNSAMDGYAVHADDVRGASADAPITLPVLETVAAGAFPSRELRPGEAMRVMTGAPVPEGADSVIRVEDTDGGVSQVHILLDRDAGKNLRQRGEDLREGEVALPAGMPIGAAQIGILASIGQQDVSAHRRPRVVILGSGDELVRIDQFDQVLAGRRIVSSNAYTIAAMIEATGGEAIDLGHCEDTLPAMRALLEKAVALAPDLIVTTAGVSVGEFDHTRTALEAMGARMDFWKVRMRPGAPLGFGHLGATPWIGLPGNPVSAMVTCELFVRPAIRRMLGYTRVHRQPVRVQLDEAVTIHAKLTHFLRAIVSPRADGGLSARLTGPQGSSILTSMSLANALLIVPDDRSTVAAGESLSAFLLSDAASMGEAFTL